jgi:hypothetical protein
MTEDQLLEEIITLSKEFLPGNISYAQFRDEFVGLTWDAVSYYSSHTVSHVIGMTDLYCAEISNGHRSIDDFKKLLGDLIKPK